LRALSKQNLITRYDVIRQSECVPNLISAVSTQVEAGSHECERCTQECVRHDLGDSFVYYG
jgi:hypothetical protein